MKVVNVMLLLQIYLIMFWCKVYKAVNIGVLKEINVTHKWMLRAMMTVGCGCGAGVVVLEVVLVVVVVLQVVVLQVVVGQVVFQLPTKYNNRKTICLRRNCLSFPGIVINDFPTENRIITMITN